MDKEYIYQLIMSSYVLSTEKKLILISAIERDTIDEDKLKEIVETLEKAKEEIDTKTEKLLNEAKKNYYNLLSKNIKEAEQQLQKINLETSEVLVKEEE